MLSEADFESAVDCAAFAFRLAERGSQVRFCTQEFDVSFPEEGDIYSILKHLGTALVSPMKWKSSGGSRTIHRVFRLYRWPTANPQRTCRRSVGDVERGGRNARAGCVFS